MTNGTGKDKKSKWVHMIFKRLYIAKVTLAEINIFTEWEKIFSHNNHVKH